MQGVHQGLCMMRLPPSACVPAAVGGPDGAASPWSRPPPPPQWSEHESLPHPPDGQSKRGRRGAAAWRPTDPRASQIVIPQWAAGVAIGELASETLKPASRPGASPALPYHTSRITRTSHMRPERLQPRGPRGVHADAHAVPAPSHSSASCEQRAAFGLGVLGSRM
eukprot:298633-Chlamydomonas_euryale.AAC.5